MPTCVSRYVLVVFIRMVILAVSEGYSETMLEGSYPFYPFFVAENMLSRNVQKPAAKSKRCAAVKAHC